MSSSPDEHVRHLQAASTNGGEEAGGGVGEDVQFDEASGKDGFAIHSDIKQVRVHPSHELAGDSSPFHFNTIVDYTWETQYSHGRLIATHISSLFIAYVVKVSNAGAVRVIDMESKERVLMKGDKGLIKDVDFLHKLDDVILAFIDEYGTFYINKIIKELKTGKLTAHPVIKVTLDGSPVRLEHRRFIWCKYVPDELKEVASPKDCAYHYAVLQNDTIYAGNLVQLVQNQGEGPHQFNEIRDEFLQIDTHSGAVTDASFAPDGTALATASKDGTVKFFQIYFQERAPARCLYSWAPHDGRPVDKIFFLDNHTLSKDNVSESQYWKFMITAADNCSELKLFTCKSWECLQTLKFTTPKTSQWKLELNLTARYLMATDIHKKAMYLLHLDCTEHKARFDWVQEFSMPWNTIGFNLSSASRIQFGDAVAKGYGPAIMGDHGSYSKEDVLNLVEINVVQPRSMQQGSVALKSPKIFTRSRSNGARRISFNRSIDLREFVDPDKSQSPQNLSHQEGTRSVRNVLTASSGGMVPIRATSLEADHHNHRRHQPPSPTSSNHSIGSSSHSTKQRRSTSSLSPNNVPREVPSAAEMTEQLSSLMGVSPAAPPVPVSAKTSSSSRTKSPSPRPVQSFVSGREGHTNGSASKTSTSSSPSREVEEILSPKSTQNFGGVGSNIGFDDPLSVLNATLSLDPTFENGNIMSSVAGYQQLLGSSDRKSPQKTKSATNTDFQGNHLVLEKINSLTALVCAQADQIQGMKQEMNRLTVMQLQKNTQESDLLTRVIENHAKLTQSQFVRIEEMIRSLESSEKHHTSQAVIPPNLAELLASSIGKIVKTELDVVVPATLSTVFDPAKLNVVTQIDRLTNVVEAKLAQNINQIMQRDRIWQTLTNNFQSITKNVFDSTFNDIFMNSVFPRCQTAVQEMLTQVNETFRNGTREYLTGLEGVLERERRRENVQELITQQISSMQDALSSTLQVEIEAQMVRVLGGIQGGVVRQIEDSMTRELSRSFQEQQRFLELSVGPRSVTPAVSICESLGGMPVSDARANKRRVMEMARNGDVRGAFTLASSLGDADTLMQLCKSYNAAVLPELNLSSSVHLSIMQLLASDILEDTEVKIDYLNMSIMCLDMSESKNIKGVTRLIPVYQAAVTKFEDRNLNSSLLPRIKILQMAFGKAPQQIKSSSSQSSLASHSFSQFQQ
ncbi:enhancer of mRNA-decapping protein 4 isoform X2 [Folsomia candida]|uniref:enhancer of mRNA-decapping protein 4 isoform X2 n=1 Tax=Folsomia candida TaxID=158441 RepID=UPI000B8F0158|nr:enhancer of mRNA-decapping protein 4 isoform X2 [Folsomia candida]